MQSQKTSFYVLSGIYLLCEYDLLDAKITPETGRELCIDPHI